MSAPARHRRGRAPARPGTRPTTSRRRRACRSSARPPSAGPVAWPPRGATLTSGCSPSARRRRGRAGRARGPRRTGTRSGRTGPRRRSRSVRAATQAAIAQPTRRGARARHGSKCSRSARGIARGGQTAGSERRRAAGQRVRAALDAAVALSSRGTSSASRARARAASRSTTPSSSSLSGFSRTVTVVPRVRDAGVVRRAEPGVAVEHDRRRAPPSRATAAPPSREPCRRRRPRRRGEMALDRASSAASWRAESCMHDDDGEVMRRGPARTACSRARRACPGSARRPGAPPRPGAAQRPRLALPQQRARPAPRASPGGTRTASVAERLGEHRQVGRRSPAFRSAAASTGGRPKPSSHDGRDDRQRAGYSAASSSSSAAPHAADAGAGDRDPPVADDHELGLAGRAPRARSCAAASTSGALRGSSAPTNSRYGGRRPRRGGACARWSTRPGATTVASTRQARASLARTWHPRRTITAAAPRRARRAARGGATGARRR